MGLQLAIEIIKMCFVFLFRFYSINLTSGNMAVYYYYYYYLFYIILFF